MRATLCREYYDKQTHGILEVFDEDTGELEFTCNTLELPDRQNQRSISCIPEGFYDVIPRNSVKYSDHLHITNVDGRSLILIHWGNYAGSMNPRTGHSDIRGCILVGNALVDIDGDGIKDITSSKNTFKELMKVAPDGFVLEVTQ
jgi:hypothetical protein